MSSFLGREGELAAIDARFGEGAQIVTIVGPPGVGKTRLARRWLAQRRGTFVNLAPCHSRSELMLALTTAMGVLAPARDEIDELGRLLAALAPHALVLDNAEHLLSETASVVERLSVPLLVTSRAPLRVEGEVRLLLAPLPEASAIQLFFDRARAVAPDMDRERDEAIVAAIVKRLDHLPLAIELAAARCGVLAPAEVLRRIDERFALLSDGGAHARFPTLEAAIEWSWNLLQAWEQQALVQCTVFPGSFTVEAAEQVIALEPPAPPVLDVVQSLHDRSLLFARSAGTGPRRLELYESVREFARERAGSIADAELRHAHYCLANAESQPLHHDLLAVVERASTDASLGARAALASIPTLLDRGPIDEALRLARHAAALAEALGTPELRAEAELAMAEGLRRRGSLREALAHHTRAQALSACSVILEARARLAEAVVRRDIGEYEDAFALADAAFELADQHGDAALAARARLETSMLCLQLQHEDARASCYEALERCRSVGRPIDVAIARASCGYVEHDLGDYDAAEQAYRETLAAARELDEPRLQCVVLAAYAFLQASRGALQPATDHAREALAHAQRFGDRRLSGYTEMTLALLAALSGDVAGSERALAVARTTLAACGDDLMFDIVVLCDAAPSLARAEATTDMARAREHHARAQAAMRRARTPRATADDVELPLAGRSVDARFVLQILDARARALAARLGETQPSSSRSPKLEVAADGGWFKLRGQPRIAMAHRPILASVLTVLARARAERPGIGVNPDDLFAAAWRGERAVRRARNARVYVAISSLRKLGLADVLRRTHEGYLLDPAIAFESS